MAKLDLTSREWCDLIFEGRNKEYGAYKMRARAPRRLTFSVILVIVIALVGFSIPKLITMVTPEKKEVMTEVTTLSQLEEPEVKQEEKVQEVRPVESPPPALKSSIKFTAPVIKKDEEVADEDEMKSQEELTESKVTISIADVKGNDEEGGQLLEDLKQIVTEAPEEEQVFDMVEQKPQFPGGDAEMMAWLSKNLHYPPIAAENGTQGVVVCQFVVGSDGTIRDVKVMRSLDPSCDKEAVRAIMSMPKWLPGRQNGKAVAARFTLPVRFKLN
ncbi:energy transducer TonB [Mediterranea sp. An20]|uniref:energy transducer TonB n=1 Tax=Mediterranea sp. An20 TaxID=1965586 RepID=UPI000B369A34|nr:energy transducer TonB [Mediterranea sp. An20]OUP07489.1 energy transducer TonB [Mediterranea sp. An20]